MLTSPRSLNRRAFLRYSAALVSGAVAARLHPQRTARPALAASLAPVTSAWQWDLRLNDLTPIAGPAMRGRRPYAVSRPVKMPQGFNALGADWTGATSPAAPWRLEFRASSDGQLWSPWLAAPALASLPGDRDAPPPVASTDVVGLAGQWVQARLCLPDGMTRTGVRPTPPNRVAVTLIRSTDGSAPIIAGPAGPGGGITLSAVAPRIIPRAEWGADESLRFSGGEEIWVPRHAAPQVVIIHHTVTANGDPDPAATVRAVYYYHASVLGWGDIGYHYLVDAWGNIYEGRVQGPTAEGGHVYGYNRGSVGIALLGNFETGQPSDAAVSAVAGLIAGLASDYGLDPQGQTFFVDGTFPVVASHRDYLNTACPGQHLYAQIAAIRGDAVNVRAEHQAEFLSHGLPGELAAGAEVQIPVTVRNSGSDTWSAGGTQPYRLGYRWYDPQGNKYNAEPELEVHTDLPFSVAPGQQVTVNMALRVPVQPGMYHIKTDMVHELVTWFEDAGSEPLLVNAEVIGQSNVPEYRTEWLSEAVPSRIRRGAQAGYRIRVSNGGANTWTRTMPNPYRLSYRWFDMAGNKYNNEPTIELRTGLPRDIAPGQTLDVPMALRAPLVPGRYLLKIDMVHEGVTWFEDTGQPPLVLRVTVT